MEDSQKLMGACYSLSSVASEFSVQLHKAINALCAFEAEVNAFIQTVEETETRIEKGVKAAGERPDYKDLDFNAAGALQAYAQTVRRPIESGAFTAFLTRVGQLSEGAQTALAEKLEEERKALDLFVNGPEKNEEVI